MAKMPHTTLTIKREIIKLNTANMLWKYLSINIRPVRCATKPPISNYKCRKQYLYHAMYMDAPPGPRDLLEAAFPMLRISRHSPWSTSPRYIAAPMLFSPSNSQ